MAGVLEKCCACQQEQSQVWRTSESGGKSLSRSPPRSAPTSWAYWASQMELAKGLSHLLDDFTQFSWLGTKRERVFGMTPCMVGVTTQ